MTRIFDNNQTTSNPRNRSTLFLALPLLLVCGLTLSACITRKAPLMAPAESLPEPDLDHVLITFVRPSIMSPTLKSQIWHGEKLIGELGARSYIQYETTPGDHLFMAKSEFWSYLEASMQGGRHYVVVAKIYPGGYSTRIELEPARSGEKKHSKAEIDGWLKDLKGQKAVEDIAEAKEASGKSSLLEAKAIYDGGRAVVNKLNPGDAW